MNGPMFRFWLLATAALALALPGAAALDGGAPTASVDDKCARTAFPPCGYIYPTIGLTADVPAPFPTSQLPQLPQKIDIAVTYSWDMEQDGTGLPGDTEEMKITLLVNKKPDWMRAQVGPMQCTFRIIPSEPHYDVCTVTLTTEIITDPTTGLPVYPASETDLKDFGNRIMVVAKSEESGMFKTSYGVEDIRFKFDEAPAGGGPIPGTRSVGAEQVEAPLPGLVALVAIGLALAALRRRRL